MSANPETAPGARGAALHRFALAPLIFVVIGFAILCGLGVWQVQRLAWKTQLLARIAALQTAPPEPLSVVLNRVADKVDVDFTHVAFHCPTLEETPTARLYVVTDQGVGDRIITACPLNAGPFKSILVDRGYLERDAAAAFKAAGPPTAGLIVGALRKGAAATAFTPAHTPTQEWFSRDIPGIAASLGAPSPAPVFFMLESPRPTAAGPTPAPAPTDIPNNHLGYAITWFGLAAALVGVYTATLLRRRKV